MQKFLAIQVKLSCLSDLPKSQKKEREKSQIFKHVGFASMIRK
jgi:hypothetical protein